MLEDTPATILATIFSYLPEEHVKKEVRLVCKRWYKVVQEPRHPVIKNVNIPFHEELSPSMMKLMQDDALITSILKNLITPPISETNNHKTKTKNKKNYVSRFEKKASMDSEKIRKTSQTFPVIKLGSYSEKMSISIRRSDDISELLEEVVHRKPELKVHQLSHLNIQLMSNAQSNYKSDNDISIPIYMSDLIEIIGSGLESLVIQDSICSLRNQRFDLRSGKYNCACFLRSVKIISPNSTMTKTCLLYLMSSNFGSLDELHLFLKLREPHDGRGDVVWAQLKSFCLVKLEKYNVFFKDRENGSQLFSYNNCNNEKKNYQHRCNNFDNSDSFTLTDDNRAGYQILWEDDWS